MSVELTLDASAIAALVLGEEGAVDTLPDMLAEARRLWTTPFAEFEVANALWKHRDVFANETAESMSLFYALQLDVRGSETLTQRALELAVAHDITVYDAAYIALAEETGSTLVTLDRLQAQKARASGVNVVGAHQSALR